MSTRLVLLAPAVALLLASSACGGGSEGGPATVTQTETETVVETETVETEPSGGDGLAERCENPDAGYAVYYPAGWQTNDGSVTAPCSLFHPEEFELPEASEPPPLAVSISRERVAFADVTRESPATRVVASEEVEVAGRAALRRETESTGDGLLPAGVRSLEYLVDLDGETLVAATRSQRGLDFERNGEVLQEMVATLELR